MASATLTTRSSVIANDRQCHPIYGLKIHTRKHLSIVMQPGLMYASSVAWLAKAKATPNLPCEKVVCNVVIERPIINRFIRNHHDFITNSDLGTVLILHALLGLDFENFLRYIVNFSVS